VASGLVDLLEKLDEGFLDLPARGFAQFILGAPD
jgi:hypothetical protein